MTDVVQSEADARRIAESLLDLELYLIIKVIEFDVGWVYCYDSRRHYETGDFKDSLIGNAPILVDRRDGCAHYTGTARPIAQYIERYKQRDPNDERSWHP